MAIKNKLALLIEVLPWLSQNPGSSVKQTAEHFQISEADLLALLQLAVLTGPGQGGGELIDIDFEDTESLFVVDAKGLDRPVKFSLETTLALVGGLQYLLQIPGSLDKSALHSLLAKLQQTLQTNHQVIEVVTAEAINERLTIINDAITSQQCIEIEYLSPVTGNSSTRSIEPKSLLISAGHHYVSAWCNAAIDFRMFRIDRIAHVSILDRKQEIRSVPAEPDFIGPIEARVICDPLTALDFDGRMIADRRTLDSGEVELVLGVHDLDWLAGEILASGGRLRPIAPAELAEKIQIKVDSWRELNQI